MYRVKCCFCICCLRCLGLLSICLLNGGTLSAQVAKNTGDSLRQMDLSDVVITATRTERALSTVPMPVTIINQAQIRQMGSLRLNEILQEQTGLAIVTNHGQGIQMQGFDPDYTLILIDGEPLVGRTAGTLELSRIAVGNIKQIEIVKGPTSSLYGSEALAGVVNIITETPTRTSAQLSSRYGTNRTADLSAGINLKNKDLGVYLFANRYASGGYDFTPETFGQTIEPFAAYTFQTKLYYTFHKALKLQLSGRFYSETQASNFALNSGTAAEQRISGEGLVQDYNLAPTLEWRVSERWKSIFRLYHSQYQTRSALNYQSDNSLYEATFFTQHFTRLENQTEYFIHENHYLTLGIGHLWEDVSATRYERKQLFETIYGFAQYEWTPSERWNITAGARLDAHSVYGSQISPKAALQYEFSPKWALRASVGRGFKAPDFRQLYLNFNNAAAGYAVLGAEELPRIIGEWQSQGLISELLLDPTLLGNIRAESSTAYNLGFRARPLPKLRWTLNLFRNDVQDLIETQVVARRTNGQNIFSYRNLSAIYTQGVETDLSYVLSPSFTLSGGYQFLDAKDKEVLDQIDAGQLFSRDPQTLITRRITRQDYGGLFNRSRHMANVKLFYNHEKTGTTANLRAVYRGRYGFGDRNGNLILDDDSEYVPGFWTLNATAAKRFYKQMFQFQVGCENLLNQQNQQMMPNMPGRLWWASLSCQL
ncbi:TonB-dependent receptor plug domain-containing protein [Eisenibacter elegans]|uniref:TonB-dependent receptor plug domain-containing protein n=1 Tax=Eisenibacter elegans TaxID=997 RepID=UPI0009D6A22F|nr:TonB-dependent receptor [Eisenibacter elegans]